MTLEGNKTNVVEAQVRTMRDGGLLVLLDGNLHVVYGRDETAGLRLIVDSKTCMFAHEYDPTSLRTTTPGKLVRHLVPGGAAVRRGMPYAEVEVMKMYLNLTAPEDGRITWALSEGTAMAAGDLLARMELDDPSRVMRPVEFVGTLPVTKPPSIVGDKPHQLLRTATAAVKRIIEGYDNQKVAESVDEMLAYLANPHLPLFELRESLSVLTGRLPPALKDSIEEVLAEYEAVMGTPAAIPFNGARIQQLIDDQVARSGDTQLARSAAPLHELAGTYMDGVEGHSILAITALFKEFLALERLFYNKSTLTVLRDMREKHKDDLQTVMNLVLALHPQSKRSLVILTLLMRVETLKLVDSFLEILQEMSLLSGRSMEISMRAKRMIIRAQLPSPSERLVTLEQMLRAVAQAPADNQEERLRSLKAVVHQTSDLLDVILPLIAQSDPAVREVGTEVYIRRAYNAYQVTDFRVISSSPLRAEWSFVPVQTPGNPYDSPHINLKAKQPRKGSFALVEPGNTVDAIVSTLKESLGMSPLLSVL